MNAEICIIFLGGSDRQHKYFFPSYFNCLVKINHDIIYVHRNENYLNRDYKNSCGKIIYENSFIDGIEIPHRAFGKYRYYFNKYKNDYKYFLFISDDVVLKRDYWLEYCIEYLNRHEKQGAISPMLSNKPKHIRAPFWIAKSECLKKINWEFDDDHDGEMKIADQITKSGYFITQVGEKITFGYDPEDLNLWILEKENFPNNNIIEKLNINQIQTFKNKYLNMFYNKIYDETLKGFYIPYNTLLELEPLEGLIYNDSLKIIEECGLKYDSFELELNIINGLSHFSINKENNINILKW